jgi:Phospholipase_D-nuclease N-terminal
MPLQDIFWTTLMLAGFALEIWLLFVVLRDVFDRPDLSGGAKVAWTVLACLVPVLGSIAYLVTRSSGAGELRMGAAPRRPSTGIYD